MSVTHRSFARLLRSAAAVAAATTAALVLPAGASSASAVASTQAAPLAAESELTLSVIPEDRTETNPRSTVALDCGPAGGNHPDPALACEELTLVRGLFEDLDRPAFCSAVWDPVTITATGTWQGREIDFSDSYSNRMCAENATGRVFAF